MEGKIVSVKNGYFFIKSDGEDYFCHIRSYNDDNPEIDDLVEFEVEKTKKGLQAVKARLIQKEMKDEKHFHNKDRHGKKEISNKDELLSQYFIELEAGYFNENGSLKENLIIEFPQKLARHFDNGYTNKPNKVNQVYQQVKNIEGIYKYKKEFDYVIEQLNQLIPKLHDNKSRKLISEEFHVFLIKNIEEAKKSEKNFTKGFIKHLEALICYYKT